MSISTVPGALKQWEPVHAVFHCDDDDDDAPNSRWFPISVPRKFGSGEEILELVWMDFWNPSCSFALAKVRVPSLLTSSHGKKQVTLIDGNRQIPLCPALPKLLLWTEGQEKCSQVGQSL